MIIELEGNKNYYFCLLGSRFQKIIDDLTVKLSERYGRDFEPIYVSESPSNNAEKLHVHLGIEVEDPQHKFYAEELNMAFSKSEEIKEIIENLKKHQEKIFLFSFTSAFLSGNADGLDIIGPSPKIAEKFDSKAKQALLFEKLDIRTPVFKVFENIHKLQNDHHRFPFYLSAEFSNGGVESSEIKSEKELNDFCDNLRPINKAGRFTAGKIVDFKETPNISALILPNGEVMTIAITDQILISNIHAGNIFPSAISDTKKSEIQAITQKIGNYMAKRGFYGLFGCDFLIDQEDKIYTIDLNPRRQGSYMPNYLSSKVDLLDIELDIREGKEIKTPTDPIEPDFAWVMAKISTENEVKIFQKFKYGKIEAPFSQVGEHYVKTYYDANSKNVNKLGLGVYMATDKDRLKMVEEMKINVNKILASITAESLV